MLKHYNIAAAMNDSPPQDKLQFLSNVTVTANHAFIRWHGRNSRHRYNYLYSKEELMPWVPKVKRIRAETQVVRGYLNFAFVSTLMKDDSPLITPTWVDIEKNADHNIIINSAEGRVKHKNVSRDPRLAISVVNGSNPYEMVTIRRKVIEQIAQDTADKHIDKLAKKYLGVDKYPGRSPGEKRVILKVKPEKIFYQPPIRQSYFYFLVAG